MRSVESGCRSAQCSWADAHIGCVLKKARPLLFLPDHHSGKNLVSSHLPQTTESHALHGGICFGEVGGWGGGRRGDGPHTRHDQPIVVSCSSLHLLSSLRPSLETGQLHQLICPTTAPAKGSPPRCLLNRVQLSVEFGLMLGKGDP